MRYYTKPEEMIYNEINSVITEEKLKRSFRKKFPDEDFDMWLEVYNETYQIRRKYVQGIGTFLFFTQKGSTKFHEHILDIVIKKLQNNKIKYRRGQVRRGADIFIFDKEGKKYAIELETSLLHSAQTRPRLKYRIEHCKEETVIILTLNTTDKQKYVKSDLPYLYKTVKIMTIEEMVKLFRKKDKTEISGKPPIVELRVNSTAREAINSVKH